MAAAARGQGVLDGADRLADLVMRIAGEAAPIETGANPAATS
jgi:hypothetical protein